MKRARPITFVSWRAYFRDFCEVHGQPLTHPDGRRLLFADGWSYSARSHRGPEWPPPTDPREKHRLQLTYWRLARLGALMELKEARDELASVTAAVQLRSAPLTIVTIMRDPDTGEADRQERPVDVEEFKLRVEELRQDLELAEEKVREHELELKLLRMQTPSQKEPQT